MFSFHYSLWKMNSPLPCRQVAFISLVSLKRNCFALHLLLLPYTHILTPPPRNREILRRRKQNRKWSHYNKNPSSLNVIPCLDERNNCTVNIHKTHVIFVSYMDKVRMNRPCIELMISFSFLSSSLCLHTWRCPPANTQSGMLCAARSRAKPKNKKKKKRNGDARSIPRAASSVSEWETWNLFAFLLFWKRFNRLFFSLNLMIKVALFL